MRMPPVAALAGLALVPALLLSGCSSDVFGFGGSEGSTPTPTASVAPSPSPSVTLKPTPGPTVTPTPTPTAAPNKIITLEPDQVTPIDSFRPSSPNGSFPLGSWLPNGFPAGIPAFQDAWVKSSFLSFVNGDGRQSYGVMFAGPYSDVDALLVEFTAQGWQTTGDETLPTRRVVIVQNAQYRVIITATDSAKSGDTLIDPSYNYTIVVL